MVYGTSTIISTWAIVVRSAQVRYMLLLLCLSVVFVSPLTNGDGDEDDSDNELTLTSIFFSTTSHMPYDALPIHGHHHY